MRDGVKASYGVSAFNVQPHTKGLDFSLTTKLIRHRGDTLGGLLNDYWAQGFANHLCAAQALFSRFQWAPQPKASFR